MTKFLPWLLFFTLSCQTPLPQTGHQEIAAAVRVLLDKAYAGVDYPTYQDALKEVEAISAARLEQTPHDLQARVDQMLEYLRAAEEILRWQSQYRRESERQATDLAVRAWTERYPFLQAAVGARTQSEFDVPTALILLWDKTDEVLRGFQIKSAPL
jgi:hypothetical protein